MLLVRGLLVLSLAGFVAAAFVVDYNSQGGEDLAAFVACGALLSAALAREWTTGATWKLLDRRPLHWVGARAYGIYLVHLLVIYELRPLTEKGSSAAVALLMVLPLVLVISLLVGDLSWRFYEKPLLQRRLPWRSPVAPLAPAVPEPDAGAPPLVAAPAEATA
jgi:peptidoglycan/LPS O-acetylase OafA/YrhL